MRLVREFLFIKRILWEAAKGRDCEPNVRFTSPISSYAASLQARLYPPDIKKEGIECWVWRIRRAWKEEKGMDLERRLRTLRSYSLSSCTIGTSGHSFSFLLEKEIMSGGKTNRTRSEVGSRLKG